MIYPASTLLLATLVFNAASVLGAPVRIRPASQPVARAVVDDPVLPRGGVQVTEIKSHQRSLDDGPLDSRSIRTREISPEIGTRDTAPSDSSLEARDSLPEVEKIVRRFPRRGLEDFYRRRSQPSEPPTARSPSPEPVAPVEVERRFPRRALYERHEQRSQPAPPEARAEKAEPAQVQRRYPRAIYAKHYERSTPSEPIPVEAREPAPAPPAEPETLNRRFPRQVYAELYERQTGTTDPAGKPTGNTPSGTTPDASPSAVPSAVPSAAPSTPDNSAANGTTTTTSEQIKTPAGTPLDLNALVQNITTSNNKGSFQPGTTIKETTLLVNKVTHISEPKKEATPVKPDPVTPSKPATPVESAAPSTSSPASGGEPLEDESKPKDNKPVVGTDPAGTPTGTTPDTKPVEPSPSSAPAAQASGTPTETSEKETTSAASENVQRDIESSESTTRRSLGSDQATPDSTIRRRNLGYSGPAWASYTKRTVTN